MSNWNCIKQTRRVKRSGGWVSVHLLVRPAGMPQAQAWYYYVQEEDCRRLGWSMRILRTWRRGRILKKKKGAVKFSMSHRTSGVLMRGWHRISKIYPNPYRGKSQFSFIQAAAEEFFCSQQVTHQHISKLSLGTLANLPHLVCIHTDDPLTSKVTQYYQGVIFWRPENNS